MIGLLYPDSCVIPRVALDSYTDKERLSIQNLYGIFRKGKGLSDEDALRYAMMIIMKTKYMHLSYSAPDELAISRLVTS
jgi:hypothetical protein